MTICVSTFVLIREKTTPDFSLRRVLFLLLLLILNRHRPREPNLPRKSTASKFERCKNNSFFFDEKGFIAKRDMTMARTQFCGLSIDSELFKLAGPDQTISQVDLKPVNCRPSTLTIADIVTRLEYTRRTRDRRAPAVRRKCASSPTLS